jgi:hypothetical protein
MIKTTKAIETFKKNISRTDALIEAMQKIKAYNRLYQMNCANNYPEQAKEIKTIQDKQLVWIEQSCAEHAIISLATAFETYYKDLFQELLSKHYFWVTSKSSKISNIRDLIESKEIIGFEEIEKKLKIYNRFDYINIFNELSIPFLSPKDKVLIEYIYAKRNYYVHNANRSDKKTKLLKTPLIDQKAIQTEAKRLTTKFKRLIFSLHKRMFNFVSSGPDM